MRPGEDGHGHYPDPRRPYCEVPVTYVCGLTEAIRNLSVFWAGCRTPLETLGWENRRGRGAATSGEVVTSLMFADATDHAPRPVIGERVRAARVRGLRLSQCGPLIRPGGHLPPSPGRTLEADPFSVAGLCEPRPGHINRDSFESRCRKLQDRAAPIGDRGTRLANGVLESSANPIGLSFERTNPISAQLFENSTRRRRTKCQGFCANKPNSEGTTTRIGLL